MYNFINNLIYNFLGYITLDFQYNRYSINNYYFKETHLYNV